MAGEHASNISTSPDDDADGRGIDGGSHPDSAGTARSNPMRAFVVVRHFGGRVGSDFAASAFGGTTGATRPGPLRRFFALLLLVVLVVPVLILFVLIAIAALVLGIVVSLVSALLRAFRANTEPRWHRSGSGFDACSGHDRDASGPSEAARPIGRDREGRENVRVARRG